MSFRQQLRRSLAAMAFGPRELSQFCNLGLRDPQPEIKVWFTGIGQPRDVTHRNVLAGTKPLIVGIGLEEGEDPDAISQKRLELEFREANGDRTLLGKITLTFIEVLKLGGRDLLYLFRAHTPVNYCRAKNILWRRYLNFAYVQWKNERGPHPPEIRMLASDLHALFVFYICPRPVVLVSVVDGEAGSIFPMDIVGPIGCWHFSIALHLTSQVLPLVEHSRRIALSSVPVEKMPLAYDLAKNHKKGPVDWAALPFTTTRSSAFGLPIPEFSLRVREMEVVKRQDMGSHAFFICRLVDEYPVADGLQFFQAHGFYEGWRKQSISRPAIH